MERNTLTEEEAMRKINAQMPISVKVKKADIVIENGGTLEELEKKVAAKVIP
jgi:dephospho-CoA kinase